MRNNENIWAVALVIVKFDEKHGQQIQSCYPREALSQSSLNQLKMVAMPDCLEPGPRHDFIFMVRIRDVVNSCPLYCYIAFRQAQDSSSRRGYFQQSLVLVTRLPFSSLYFNILSRLSGVLSDIPEFESIASNMTIDSEESSTKEDSHTYSSSTKTTGSDAVVPTTPGSQSVKSAYLPTDLSILDSSLEVAFQHFVQWPFPRVGSSYNLPFYGSIIPFTVPKVPLYVLHPKNYLSQHRSLSDYLRLVLNERDSGLFGSTNLASIFGQLGLIPHLWTLWELVITGRDIVIWSPNAALCSAVVLALVSLASPLGYSGDFRPYINSYDPDIGLISDAITQHSREENGYYSHDCNASPASSNMQHQLQQQQQSTETPTNAEKIARNGDRVFSAFVYAKQVQQKAINESGRHGHGNSERSEDNNSRQRPPSVIVGITNPFLLRSFGSAHAVLLIPNPSVTKAKKPGNSGSNGSSSGNGVSGFGSNRPTNICSVFSQGVESPPTSPSSKASSSFFKSPLTHVTSFFSSAMGVSPASPRNLSRSSDRDNSQDTPMTSKTAVRYTSLGQAVPVVDLPSPVSHDSSRRRKSGLSTSDPVFPAAFKLLRSSETIESAYDDWLSSGQGKPGSSRRCSLLCSRSKPSITADPDILRSVASQQADFDIFNFASLDVPLSVNIEGNHRVSVKTSHDQYCECDADDKSIISNMLLREHFQSLTQALLRPFDGIFNISTEEIGVSPRSSPRVNGSQSYPPSAHHHHLHGSPLSNTRAGASSMILYNDPRELLGKIDIDKIVENWSYSYDQSDGVSGSVGNSNGVSGGSGSNCPKCLRQSQYHVILERFAYSDHFHAWSSWTRDTIVSQMLLETCQAYKSITSQQIIEAFAIEQGCEILTSRQIDELAQKMRQTSRDLEVLEERLKDWTLQFSSIDERKEIKYSSNNAAVMNANSNESTSTSTSISQQTSSGVNTPVSMTRVGRKTSGYNFDIIASIQEAKATIQNQLNQIIATQQSSSSPFSTNLFESEFKTTDN